MVDTKSQFTRYTINSGRCIGLYHDMALVAGTKLYTPPRQTAAAVAGETFVRVLSQSFETSRIAFATGVYQVVVYARTACMHASGILTVQEMYVWKSPPHLIDANMEVASSARVSLIMDGFGRSLDAHVCCRIPVCSEEVPPPNLPRISQGEIS